MKTAFLADIHGNLEALSAVAETLHGHNVQNLLFLGDAVGYGANPNECAAMVQHLFACALAGNHDWAATGKGSSLNFNPVAARAIAWTRETLTEANRDYLKSLPLKHEQDDFVCVHATPDSPQEWNYILNARDAASSFPAFSQPLCFIAHSHYPAVFVKPPEGAIDMVTSDRISILPGHHYIINVGSVGQPRDGDPRACCGVFDSGAETYYQIRVSYDVQRAQQKIIDAGLPSVLAQRIEFGR